VKGSAPIITCDHEDICDEWEIDHYETGASTVGGVRITRTERAPGWVNGDEDFCPEHAKEATS
jgi:hypothetical protein